MFRTRILIDYLRERRWHCLFAIAAVFFLLLVFWLYRIPSRTLAYSGVLCAFVLFCGVLTEYFFYRREWLERQRLFVSLEDNLDTLSPAYSREVQDYRLLLSQLLTEKKTERQNMEEQYQELKEYIMLWAHQVKTPITALKLLVQKLEENPQETADSQKELRHMKEELFAIETYVSMNLEYIRLDSLNADLSIGHYSVERLIKAEVHRFSPLFIAKRLSVKMDNLEQTIITDEKWFSFVLGQILSNALKYTKQGGITIYAEKQQNQVHIFVQDSGIGIAPEDMPRLFDKAFTGYNGHMDKHATGIGLYLSKKILEKLGHSVSIISEIGRGTCVEITAETSEKQNR